MYEQTVYKWMRLWDIWPLCFFILKDCKTYLYSEDLKIA